MMAKESKPPTKRTNDEDKRQLKEAEVVVEAAPVESSAIEDEAKKESLAKAGKRSAKSQKEALEKKEKEARKTKANSKNDTTKASTLKPPRAKAERAGKKYKNAVKKIEKNKTYSLNEALDIAINTSTTKFDSTVELHINLGVDPRQADQNIRGSITLPQGTGKTLKIAVFADTENDKKAADSGADIVGIEKISAALDKEEINFDVLIATPSTMARLAKYAKLLGPKGLMPNPKSGTVTIDIEKSIRESKAGKIEYRVDSSGIVHSAIGKCSFGASKLEQNAQVLIDAIKAAKPASLKGVYIKSGFITTTMGPSIRFQIS